MKNPTKPKLEFRQARLAIVLMALMLGASGQSSAIGHRRPDNLPSVAGTGLGLIIKHDHALAWSNVNRARAANTDRAATAVTSVMWGSFVPVAVAEESWKSPEVVPTASGKVCQSQRSSGKACNVPSA